MEEYQAKKYVLLEKKNEVQDFFRTVWETYFVGKNNTAMIHGFSFRNLAIPTMLKHYKKNDILLETNCSLYATDHIGTTKKHCLWFDF